MNKILDTLIESAMFLAACGCESSVNILIHFKSRNRLGHRENDCAGTAAQDRNHNYSNTS